MTAREYEQLVGADPDCRFQMTGVGLPILATRDTLGVVKINGKLVKLTSPPASAPDGMQVELSAGELEVSVAAEPEVDAKLAGGRTRRAADLVFELDGGRTVGYRGYYVCGPSVAQAEFYSQGP